MAIDVDFRALYNEQQARADDLVGQLEKLHTESEDRVDKSFKHGEVSGLEMAADLVKKRAVDAWSKREDAKATLLRDLSDYLAEMAKVRKE